MAYTFKGQTLLQIQLDTGLDLSTATELKILYKKPDGTVGEWVGVDSSTNIVYDFEDGDIDLEGTWRLQSYALIGGRVAYGDYVYLTVKEVNE
jgi:hypothetical protein